MNKLTIALLSGGDSSERKVSLKSGGQVFNALDKSRYNIIRYDPKTDLKKLVLNADKIDVALIILHGPDGEDGKIQGLLDLLKIPYQGAGLLGSALAMNKIVSKKLYQQANLKVPPYLIIKSNQPLEIESYVQTLGLPIVVKPVSGGSSIGISISETVLDLQKNIAKGFDFNNTLMLETYLSGLELTGGVIGNEKIEALPIIEIVPDAAHNFFDYQTKYTSGLVKEICPARIDDKFSELAQYLALQAHQILFCRGYSRTDMILHQDEIYILETNTIPGMTPTSLFPLAARTVGINFSQLLDKLIVLALEKD